MELLELVGLLNDLILLDDIEKCDYERATGRVSMKLKKKVEAIKGLVHYEKEISGQVGLIKEVSGVKINEVKINEVKNEVKIEVSGVKIKEVKIKDVRGVKIQEPSRGEVTISEITIDYTQSVSTRDQITTSQAGGAKISAKICFKADGVNRSFEITIAESGIE